MCVCVCVCAQLMGDPAITCDMVEQWNNAYEVHLQQHLLQAQEGYNRRRADIEIENIGATFPTQCLLCSHQPLLQNQAAVDSHRETARHQATLARRAALGFRCDLCRLHEVNNFVQYAQHMRGQMHRDLHQHLALRRSWEHCSWKYCDLCDRWTGSGSLERHSTGRRHKASLQAAQVRVTTLLREHNMLD